MKYTLRVTIKKQIGNTHQYFENRYHIEAETDEDAKKKALHAIAVLFKHGEHVVYHKIFKKIGWHVEQVR